MDLGIDQFDSIWKFLNSDSQFNWKWIAGKVGFTFRDIIKIEGSYDNPSEGFLKEWCSKGATTQQLLELLAGKRVEIIQELAENYIIP